MRKALLMFAAIVVGLSTFITTAGCHHDHDDHDHGGWDHHDDHHDGDHHGDDHHDHY